MTARRKKLDPKQLEEAERALDELEHLWSQETDRLAAALEVRAKDDDGLEKAVRTLGEPDAERGARHAEERDAMLRWIDGDPTAGLAILGRGDGSRLFQRRLRTFIAEGGTGARTKPTDEAEAMMETYLTEQELRQDLTRLGWGEKERDRVSALVVAMLGVNSAAPVRRTEFHDDQPDPLLLLSERVVEARRMKDDRRHGIARLRRRIARDEDELQYSGTAHGRGP